MTTPAPPKCTKTRRGVEVNSPQLYARIGAANVAKILEALTVRHECKIGPPKIVKLYQFVTGLGAGVGGAYTPTNTLILPHTLLSPLTTLGFRAENDNTRPPARIKATITLELFENQRVVVDRLMAVFTPERIAAGTAGAILNMRAGLGKTFTAAGVIARLQYRTLVVVVNSELARQMYDDLDSCFDGLNIGMYGGKPGKRRKSGPDDDITIMIINSALTQTEEFLGGYSFLILDEIHAYCSDTRRRIFTAANFHAVLGMSATTDNRADEMDPIAHRAVAHDGIIHAESLPGFTFEDTKFDWNVAAIHYTGPPTHTKALSHESTGRLFTPYMMKQFFADPHRCRLVRDRVLLRYSQGHNIYVFAEELAALAELKTVLAGTLPHDEVVLFTGGIDEEDAARARATGRVLLATYGYAGTGISIPKMTAIVFMSPRRENMIQIVARIGRRGSDMSRPRVIDDIIDTKTPLRAQFRARSNAYDHYEMKVSTVKISWKDLAD